MTDQYGHTLPNDLVVLDFEVTDLNPAQLKAIDQLNWYEPQDNPQLILVSFAELDAAMKATSYGLFDATDPLDCDCDLSGGVHYIADALHRHNEVDGFYHA